MHEKTPIITEGEWQCRFEIQERALEVLTRELKNNVGQTLCLAKMQLGFLSETMEMKIQEKIDATGNLLLRAIHDLKTLARQNVPDEVLRIGLIDSIRNEIMIKQQLYPKEVSVSIAGDPPFISTADELLVFCIMQDIIADNYHMQDQPDHISIRSSKNEIHFEIGRRDNHTSMRLSENVRSKVNQLNGTLSLNCNANGQILNLSIRL